MPIYHLALISGLLFFVSSAGAWIYPGEVAVLINENNPESRLIGKFYQEIREIPPDHMIYVSTANQEAISRERYNSDIANRVREFLTEKKYLKIKYLVTTRGFPRKIKATSSDVSMRQRKDFENDAAGLESELMNALKSFTIYSGWNRRTPPGDSDNPISRELIVMRLDGPGVVEIKKYLAAGLKVEEEGLKGTFCIDAMGKDSVSSVFLPFERSFLLLAEVLRGNLKHIEIELNENKGTFLPGQCPEPALFTGWYSKHQGGKTAWKSGSLGYVIAVSDSVSFDKSSGRLDAAEMIRLGASHALGPAEKAFLKAYPLPHHYFSLLLGGHHDLGEIVGQTAPHSSWMITYFGDPMYCPFEKNPQLTVDQVKRWQDRPPFAGLRK
ncbi:TIGR03790 family protein [Fibrobacterota bacterium]